MRKIKTYYWLDSPNFGDNLNTIILPKLFNINPIMTSEFDCEFSAIGSLMEVFLQRGNKDFEFFKYKYFKKPVHIWGTGFIADVEWSSFKSYGFKENFKKKLCLHALRGKITKSRAEKIFKKSLNNTVVGDPGLLVNKLIDVSKIEKKYKIGIIPHFIESNLKIFQNLKNEFKNSIIINLLDDPYMVLEQIANCELILSSALHGLIAADSLGIPNKRIVASDRLIGGDYKFKDYYSAFDLELPLYYNLYNSKIILDDINRDYQITTQKVSEISKNLIKSFPFKENI